MIDVAARMDANLTAQGYELSAEQRRSLRIGVRLSTALCLALVVVGLATQSALLILALVPIGAVGGWTARHPFDALWNHGLRHLVGGPLLPANPQPRRHTFKLATLWLLGIGLLFALDYATAALALGAVLVAVCSVVTITNFCLPSVMFGAWQRWRAAGRTS